jgi:hypothetical protein
VHPSADLEAGVSVCVEIVDRAKVENAAHISHSVTVGG